MFYRGSYTFEYCWFAVHFVVAGIFTLGWWTDRTSVALWLMTIILHGRQERFHDASDKLFANLMLWCTFLPVGEAFVFRRRAAPAPAPTTTTTTAALWLDTSSGPYRTAFTAGTAGVVLQFCSLYAGVVLRRYYGGPDWWPVRKSPFAAKNLLGDTDGLP